MYMQYVTQYMTLPHLNMVGKLTTEIQTEQYLLLQFMFASPVNITTNVD
jgi:hypothetical protein